MGIEFNTGAKSQSDNAHIIVCGNEKGGSGKTTTSMHIIVALLKAGHKVASIDLDCRQRSLSRYIENRRNWSRTADLDLLMPDHFHIEHSSHDSNIESDAQDFAVFAGILADVEHGHDFIVIDTPGSDGYLMRLAHSMADTLVTPMNDSFVDFDVLGKVDAVTHEICEISHYATMVRTARRQRRTADNGVLDWVVIRNRLSSLSSRNKINLQNSINELSLRLGFRIADGISERVIFREFFPKGLTALDELEHDTMGGRPTLSHLSARQEIRQLIRALRLPINERGKKGAKLRPTWQNIAARPMELPDIFVT